MWSVGCILGELLGGKPMFPGTSTLNQLQRICEATGMPTPEDIEAIDSPYAQTMSESIPASQTKYVIQSRYDKTCLFVVLMFLCS